MNYERFNMGAYNLHIINTSAFKTITVEVDFRRQVLKEEITKTILDVNAPFSNSSIILPTVSKLSQLKINKLNITAIINIMYEYTTNAILSKNFIFYSPFLILNFFI